MEYSNVYTAQPSIPAPVWDLRSANGLSNVQEAESGWNPSSDGVQRFSLPSRIEKTSQPASRPNAALILLVEDNRADVGLVREALEEHGVEGELVVLADGEAAINFIQSLDDQPATCPDLVIIDLNLPKRPGRDVLKFVRQSVACREVQVVILSSSDAQQDRAETLRLGASRYIRKPSRLEEFMSLGAIFKAMLGGSA